MKLLVAPWGNPYGWKEVKYTFGKMITHSKTSLKALAEALEPDLVLVLVGDTLVRKEELKEASYSAVKEFVRNRIVNFLLESNILADNFKVLVLPSVGYFPNGVFKGSALDYYNVFLYEISRLISEKDFSKLEIHLDITHGINFMPTLAYRTLKEVAQILAFFVDVKFFVYNADPFVGEPLDGLTIHIVEETTEGPGFPGVSPYKFDENDRFFEKLVISNDGKKIKGVDKEFLKDLFVFLGSFVYGLSLAMVRFFASSGRIFEHIEAALTAYEEKTRVEVSDEKIAVLHDAYFGSLFRVIVFIWLLIRFFKKTDILKNPVNEIYLDNLKSIVGKIFGRNDILRIPIDNEIYSIMGKSQYITDKWSLLNDIFAKMYSGEEGLPPEKRSPDKRNFFAHAGFERNLVEVRKENGRLVVRYSEDKTKNVKKFILEALRGGRL